MTEGTTTPETQDEDFEMILLAIAIIASFLLGYRNRDRIKSWFDGALSKFK
jgi:hypothetical protein